MGTTGEVRHPADVIAEEAREWLRLPFEKRLNRLMELCEAEWKKISSDPAALEAYKRRKEESEAAWRRAQQDLFKRFGL
jgi:hypothetical protein